MGAVDETRSLRDKVQLAEQAQRAARNMEQDYEEVVHLLEGEIAKLKQQLKFRGVSIIICRYETAIQNM